MIGSEGPQGTVADDFHGFSLSQYEINTSWTAVCAEEWGGLTVAPPWALSGMT
jgi:hypothetical protein